jgi:hypothetical protein
MPLWPEIKVSCPKCGSINSVTEDRPYFVCIKCLKKNVNPCFIPLDLEPDNLE